MYTSFLNRIKLFLVYFFDDAIYIFFCIVNCLLFDGRKECNRFQAKESVNMHYLFGFFYKKISLHIDQQHKKTMIKLNDSTKRESTSRFNFYTFMIHEC